ncbi:MULTISPECIES: cell division protein FtsL [unclassified Lactobacillus]|uniref:cell division protein FtsL n=1 Tax=unclassified Lactobacillus TaxID=2620435 RepID=UPI0023F9EF62|nr:MULTISPECIES: cell division protein FtsL [unclassified Lactobacillus]MDF7668442.1 cell division protein FtsL [Lactobacillus sp. ESL0703]WEV39338.1 cell division protein FtsL [Lactobacillus sp. ESL0680]
MADNLARKIEFNPNKQTETETQQRMVLDHRRVTWSAFEKSLLVLGTLITLGLMTLLVSSSISATSAQHELTNVQQSVAKKQSQVSDLHQEIGELTSSARMNKIARSKGLTLIEKNIRTIH